MTKKEALMKELEQVPEAIIDEVLCYIRILKSKISKGNMESALISETSLKKDWLRPEEDEAWKDL